MLPLGQALLSWPAPESSLPSAVPWFRLRPSMVRSCGPSSSLERLFSECPSFVDCPSWQPRRSWQASPALQAGLELLGSAGRGPPERGPHSLRLEPSWPVLLALSWLRVSRMPLPFRPSHSAPGCSAARVCPLWRARPTATTVAASCDGHVLQKLLLLLPRQSRHEQPPPLGGRAAHPSGTGPRRPARRCGSHLGEAHRALASVEDLPAPLGGHNKACL